MDSSSIQRDIDGVTEGEITALLGLLQITWGNIQHNETLRNVLFSLYLAVAGGYFVILRLVETTDSTDVLAIFSAGIVGLIGLLFMWVFLRFRIMIDRDIFTVSEINVQLAKIARLESISTILPRYRYRSRGILLGASVTHAFLMSTSLMAAGVVSLGVERYMMGSSSVPWIVGGVFVFFIVAANSVAFVFRSRSLYEAVKPVSDEKG